MGHRLLAIALACLTACFSKPPRPTGDGNDAGTPNADDWLADYQFRKKLEVSTGASAVLADFPVAIVRQADADLAMHATAGAFVVTGGDGLTLLDSELVAFAAGDLELWARVPSLGTATTALYLYYGGPPHESTATTWSPRFAGVWHLSESGTAVDSTAHRNDLAPFAGAPGNAAGMLGGARELDGDDGLGNVDPADGALDFGGGSFSFTLWVFQLSTIGEFDMPFYKGGPSAQEPGYCVLLGQNVWEAKIHDGTNLYDANFGNETALRDRWVHLAVTVDRGASRMTTYADGALVLEDTITPLGSLSTDEPLAIGRGDDVPFHGRVDEVRIYGDVLDAAWIAAEHANTPGSGFLTVGPEEARP